MKIMKDYCDFYLKRNGLLSVDDFEEIRNNSLKNYGLCKSHYFSVPVVAWDAMLNIP